MRVFLAAIATSLFIFSTILHAATFFGVDLVHRIPALWLLHVGILLLAIPAILLLKELLGGAVTGKDVWRRLVESTPRWILILTVILNLYMGFNFLFSLGHLNKWGMAGFIDGEPVLHKGGKVIQRLTTAEYDLHRLYEARAFTGHWLFGYWFLMAAFVARKKDSEEAEA